MRCAGCNRELEIGDRYIEDTPTGFLQSGGDRTVTDGEEYEDHPGIDDIVATIMGGSGGKIYFCDECTEPGGDYMFETYYGEEE